MALRLVAEDAFLLSETGPVPTPWLEPGRDRVWIVDRNGALALAAVADVRTASEVDALRLLSPAGDMVLPDRSPVMTSEGPMTGDEIGSLLTKGRAVRLDVISPTDLPRPNKRSADEKEVLRSCFAALPNLIQLPRLNGTADQVSPDLQRLLKRAGVRFRRIEDDRWTAFTLEPVTATVDGCRAEFGIQADVLSLATAWAEGGEGLESRVRLGDHLLRRRLLVALVGAARGYEVKWVPGYRPVESRVRTTAERQWPARVPVVSVIRGRTQAFRVKTDRDGDPIVSLAIVGLARS